MAKDKKLLCAAVGTAVLLTGVTVSRLDRIREYCTDRKAVSAAQDYLQQKYGFRGKVQEVHKLFGYSNVLFRDEQKEYKVYLDAQQKPVQDTYQYDEIVEAFKKQITDVYPDCLNIDLVLFSPEQYLEKSGYTVRPQFGLDADTEFDGSNLAEILTDCSAELIGYFTNTDFSDAALTDMLTDLDTSGRFVSFDTESHGRQFLDSNRIPEQADTLNETRFAPHITQIRTFDREKHSSEIMSLPLHEGDGFLYCCPAVPDVTCIGPEPLSVQGITGTYQFNSGTAEVFVYYPAASLPDARTLRAAFAAAGDSGIREIAPSCCGDYVVFALSGGSNPRWTLMQNKQ